MRTYRTAIVAILLAVHACAVGQSMVGRWTGPIVLDRSALKMPLDPAERKSLEAIVAKVKGVHLNINLSPDGTFSSTFTKGVGQSPARTGTWKHQGKQIRLRSFSEKLGEWEIDVLQVESKARVLRFTIPLGGGTVLLKRAK